MTPTISTPSAPGPVAIVGPGYLGARVAEQLDRPVIAVNRSGEWPEGVAPEHVRMHALDLCDPSLDPGPLAQARQLVLCVAPGRSQDRRALYVGGTARLLERLGRGALERIVWVGSTSALPSTDAWLDERCTTEPQTERGRVQRDAEHVVAEHGRRHGIPWFVLRMGGLYGPGRSLSRIYRRRGDDPLPGDGMAPTNLVHRDDAVAAILAALGAPPDRAGVVHVVDDEHTPRRVMYARIAQQQGWPPLSWAETVNVPAAPRGKRVSNRRLKDWLGVRLVAPRHRLHDESMP